MMAMVAACTAKTCKSPSKEERLNLRPCMGCRQQWIHSKCGGFCPDCQPASSTSPRSPNGRNRDSGGSGGSPIDMMKSSFCSQVDQHLRKMNTSSSPGSAGSPGGSSGGGNSSGKRRGQDRSPLILKQNIVKRLQDSIGFREGKENASQVLGKRQRKPVAPPALTPNVAPSQVQRRKSDNNNSSSIKLPTLPPSLTSASSPTSDKTSKTSPSPTTTTAKAPTTASTSSTPICISSDDHERNSSIQGNYQNTAATKKSSSSKHIANGAKRKRKSSPTTVSTANKATNSKNNKNGEPAGKKKRVNEPTGGTPKKWASEPHAKFKDNPKRIKKVVEVKILEDGTHNPDRLLYHVRSNQPVDKGEPEAEESYDWLLNMSKRQIDDFVDLNEGEKAFFKLWNTFLHDNPAYGDNMFHKVLDMFVDAHGPQIYRENLYRNFTLHLSNLQTFNVITTETVLATLLKIQRIFRGMRETPELYPPPIPKEIVDNPYYKPKPVSLESLTKMSEEAKKAHVVASGKRPSAFVQPLKKTKSGFWIKKSVRNHSSSSKGKNGSFEQVDDLEEAEAKWGRKKANVTYANEIVVQEIFDLGSDDRRRKSLSAHANANAMYNFSSSSSFDLYSRSSSTGKLASIISPRQRRGKS